MSNIQFRLSSAPFLDELLAQQAQAYQHHGHRHSPSKMARELAEAMARYLQTGELAPPASLRGVKPPAQEAAAPTKKIEGKENAPEAPAVPPSKRRAEASRFLK